MGDGANPRVWELIPSCRRLVVWGQIPQPLEAREQSPQHLAIFYNFFNKNNTF